MPLLISAIITLGVGTAYADVTITPQEMSRDSLDVITISGSADKDALHVLIVMEHPDYTTQEHNAFVGQNNVFSYFLNPDDTFPSGTYLVKVRSINDSKNKLVGTAAFSIYDGSDSFDFVIGRGAAAKSCDGCISPARIVVYEKSIITWHNNDSAIHDIQYEKSKSKEFVGTLKPGESRSVHAASIGTKDYHCTIHPWIHGEIAILKNSFGFPARELDDMPGSGKTSENVTDNVFDQDASSGTELGKTIISTENIPESLPEKTEMFCESCFGGIITKVVDGYTIDIDGKRIRLALVDTPERGEIGYQHATDFTKFMCPVGSTAFYSIDKKQPVGPYGRVIAEVFCGDASLNQKIIEKKHGTIHTRYCDSSDFASSAWAAKKCRTDHTSTANSTGIISNTLDDVAEIPSDVAKDIVLLQSGNDDSNPFDPDSYSVTLAQMITVACVGIVAIILIMAKKSK